MYVDSVKVFFHSFSLQAASEPGGLISMKPHEVFLHEESRCLAALISALQSSNLRWMDIGFPFPLIIGPPQKEPATMSDFMHLKCHWQVPSCSESWETYITTHQWYPCGFVHLVWLSHDLAFKDLMSCELSKPCAIQGWLARFWSYGGLGFDSRQGWALSTCVTDANEKWTN